MRGFIRPLFKGRPIAGPSGFGRYGRCDDCGAIFKSVSGLRMPDRYQTTDDEEGTQCPSCCQVDIYEVRAAHDFIDDEGRRIQHLLVIAARSPLHAHVKWRKWCSDNMKSYLLKYKADIVRKYKDVKDATDRNMCRFIIAPVPE